VLTRFPVELLPGKYGSPLEKRCPDAERGRAGGVVYEVADKAFDARPSNTKTTVSSARNTLCRRKPARARP
jgi:hypothetical protein